MTRWIAGAAIGAAAIWGLGHERAPATAPEPTEQQITAPEQMSASELFQETATHEAGHWAAAREFGIPVWGVEADASGNGETVYPDHYFRDPQRDAYDYAVIGAAGEEAAAAWLEQRGYAHDRAITEAESHAHSDLAQLTIDASRAGISAQYAHEQARQIVRDHQPDINRLADRLIERGGHLDEAELER